MLPVRITHCSDLVSVQNFQESFIDVGLALETVFYLVYVIDGMVELNRLVVLQRWATGGCAAHWCVRLD